VAEAPQRDRLQKKSEDSRACIARMQIVIEDSRCHSAQSQNVAGDSPHRRRIAASMAANFVFQTWTFSWTFFGPLYVAFRPD
jgi:hypothetical protein